MHAQIFLKPFIGEMFTYKKHSVHRNSSTIVINMVTDIKQTCFGQGLGVTFTARKHPSKLMFTMKDLGHTVTCLATDARLTANPGVASSIPVRSHTFVEIDHEIISTVILLPSADLFMKGCCQLQAKVCARITG